MDIQLFQVDAFANQIFEGNPAAVCPLPEWLPDHLLQKIALENNLSETAYFVLNDKPLKIRWFTPTTEVNLCGHATLASAHVLSKHLGFTKEIIEFNSLSGPLSVRVNKQDYTLNFPADKLTQLSLDNPVVTHFDPLPINVLKGSTDYLLVYENEKQIQHIQVDFGRLANFDGRGVIVTSPSRKFDFVSRSFYPQSGVNEDPATGSAHTTLAVFWSKELGKEHLIARQISARGGSFDLQLQGDRVMIRGGACTFLIGTCRINS
jgi:PhzF family phenazine biosynthesis protein